MESKSLLTKKPALARVIGLAVTDEQWAKLLFADIEKFATNTAEVRLNPKEIEFLKEKQQQLEKYLRELRVEYDGAGKRS